MHKQIFNNWIVCKRGKHIRAFASETIDATLVLSVLAETVLLPNNILPRHCECLLKLQHIFDILLSGDEALKHIDKLSELLIDHHKEMVSLSGEDIAKIKPHLMHHVPRQMQKKEANMSCFPGERMHVVSKGCRGK